MTKRKPCVVTIEREMNWAQLVEYRTDGTLVWKERKLNGMWSIGQERRWNTRYAGSRAGGRGAHYNSITALGTTCPEHRVIWILHYGQPPSGMYFDHINGNKRDNRIENLRLASRKENKFNSKVRADSHCMLRGVGKVPAGWNARIQIGDKRVHLGRFQTKGLAALAYAKASIQHHGPFSPFISRT